MRKHRLGRIPRFLGYGMKNYQTQVKAHAKKEKPQIEIDIDDLKSKVAKLEADIKKKKNK